MLQENHWFLRSFCCRKTTDLPLTNSCKWEKKILWLFPLCSRRKTIDLHYFSISRSTNAEEWCIKAMIHKTEPLIQYCFFYSVIFVSLVVRFAFFSLADIICLSVNEEGKIDWGASSKPDLIQIISSESICSTFLIITMNAVNHASSGKKYDLFSALFGPF